MYIFIRMIESRANEWFGLVVCVFVSSSPNKVVKNWGDKVDWLCNVVCMHVCVNNNESGQ